MRFLRILLLLILIVVVLGGIGGFALFNDFTKGPLPVHSGDVTLKAQTVDAAGESVNISGLSGEVEILRDEWGVPHIYASTPHDLFFAQGYTQAQDRWWQMEFFRATGDGRIQELTGANDAAMSNDLFIRTIGWRRAAERDVRESYDADTLALMQAFSDGVNAYIFSRPASDLAMEYNLLGLTGVNIEIRPWTVADTIVWQKVMSWDLGGGLDDLDRMELREAIGDELFTAYEPEWPFGEKPTIIQPEDLPLSDATLTMNDSLSALPDVGSVKLAGNFNPDRAFAFGRGEGIGSNNWVVSGDLTATGKPLLANDPHLGIQMPSIWYEVGLHCLTVNEDCPYDVVGFALSPFPGVVIGHNAHIAWGFTNVGPDVQDLYLIKVNPDNPLQYEWDGEWRDMTVHEETISFGDGGEPVTIQVRETHLGPIINDNQMDDEGNITGFNNENPIAFRWTALDPSHTLRGIFGLDKATNWEQFRAALQDFDSPSQNIIYADLEGNIGYQTPGLIPVRPASNDGRYPVDGSTSENEWLGYIPYDSLPRVFNPERGYIATANQALVPLEYYAQLSEQLADEFGADANYVISHDWDYGYRGQRVVEMIEATVQHDVESFRHMQGDNMNLSAREIMPYLEQLEISDSNLAAARDWLLAWDYQLHMDSPQAALYMNFWMQLVDNLFDDQFGEFGEAGTGAQQMWATALLLEQPDHVWWDDVTTADTVETRDEILLRSFTEGHEATVEALGSDREQWKWGRLHTSTFVSNPLGVSGIEQIEGMVNRGPVMTSGGSNTVNATAWRNQEDFTVRALPSFRMIVDLSDFANSVNIHTTGQSGHPYSDHYGNMIDSWRNIQYKPMLFSREQVEAAAKSRLTLKP